MMTGNTDTKKRRKQLLFRAEHRGTRELDMLIGQFAVRYLNNFSDEDLQHFAILLEVSDPVIYSWITGASEIPPEYQNPVMDLLKNFKLF